jgi:disulfide bond formation protein DsbB
MLAPPEPRGAARRKQARQLARLVTSGLLGGALLYQNVGGLYPCELCYWQRWPHGAAILLALAAFFSPLGAPRTRSLVLLAALAIAVSGAIGVFHAGVELG